MQIPGGDLAPARRRRYGGGYGRRRRRRQQQLAGVVVIALLAGGAALAWDRQDGPSATPRTTATPCPSASPTPTAVALPSPSQVRLVLLNGTSRNGLAKSVGQALTARGFVVIEAATAPAALAGPSQVVWGAGAEPAALLLAQQLPSATVLTDPRLPAGAVRVTLGSDFTRLADPVAPAPTASATATPCVSMQR